MFPCIVVGYSGADMFGAIAEFTASREDDSTGFMEKVRAVAIGVVQDYEPARLYAVRIDSWFGPKWMGFAGKFSVASGIGFGVHKARLHVPPFVPARVMAERVFDGPGFEDSVATAPLHIYCTSKVALQRRLADIDKDAAFIWFSGESKTEQRGAVMVYPPVGADDAVRGKRRLRDANAFYAGFSQKGEGWGPVMLRGLSRTELAHLEECGVAVAAQLKCGDSSLRSG
jgi:hypothetical protein